MHRISDLIHQLNERTNEQTNVVNINDFRSVDDDDDETFSKYSIGFVVSTVHWFIDLTLSFLLGIGSLNSAHKYTQSSV